MNSGPASTAAVVVAASPPSKTLMRTGSAANAGPPMRDTLHWHLATLIQWFARWYLHHDRKHR